MIAIEHAYRVLGWQENLQEDEMPPQWMWHLEHEIEPWFDEVKRRREEKHGRPGDSDNDTRVPMMSNEYAENMRR